MPLLSPAPSRRPVPGWSGLLSRCSILATLAFLLCAVTCLTDAPRAVAATQAQALVLDPFPDQHSPAYSAQDVVGLLQTAGFAVTLLHGSQVTVSVMQHLSRYSVIYIFTHSGPLPNNDAAVSTGDTRH